MMPSARLLCLITLSSLLSLPAWAQTPASGPEIELTVDAQQSAPNDLGRATLYVEMQDASPAELAVRVNNAVGTVLGIATRFSAVKTRTGDVSTYPVYGKTNRIESWRMRADVLLESRDISTLSELLGRLQTVAALGDVQLSAAPETRKRAEDEAIRAALEQFQSRARLVSEQMGKSYRVISLVIDTGMRRPALRPMLASRAMTAEAAAPMAVSAGESNIEVVVRGKIALNP
jgi:predicted secreted protein